MPTRSRTKPLIAFAYLVVVGSLVAFSAYMWLLRNVRISLVATYAFVNPVVAVAARHGVPRRDRSAGDRRRRRRSSSPVALIVTRVRRSRAGGRRGRLSRSKRLRDPRYPGLHDELRPAQVRAPVGEEHREEIEVELEPFELGGERYLPVPEQVPARARDHAATHRLGLRAAASPSRLHGPCYRCLGDAVVEVADRRRASTRRRIPRASDELRRRTSTTTASTSRRGRATRSPSRCPTRSSAVPTAPGSARSAART